MANIVRRIKKNIPAGMKKKRFFMSVSAEACCLLLGLDKAFQSRTERALSAVMQKHPGTDEKTLLHDMLKEYFIRDISPEEYMKFDLQGKPENIREEYYSEERTVRTAKAKNNSIMTDNKYERYQMFRDYVKRDVVCVGKDGNMKDVIRKFGEKHSEFVAKPIFGTKGHGVMLVNAEDTTLLEEKIRTSRGGYLLEERIEQGKALAVFHPYSVNTIRFVSASDKEGGIHFLFALLRTGRNKSFVDNVGSGGIAAAIDLMSGVICSDGLYWDTWYHEHPDTGTVFKGYQIPEWSELLRTVKEIHGRYGKQRVMGFDFALTPNGWDIVEVNPAPSLSTYQAISGKGIRPALTEISLL